MANAVSTILELQTVRHKDLIPSARLARMLHRC